MFKNYYLIHAFINDMHVNSYTDLSIAEWLVSCSQKGLRAVVVNYWKISKKEYELLKTIKHKQVIE